MTVISGTLSVDTFLIISGFLLAYSIMKMKSRASNINVIPAAIFHRYLRQEKLLFWNIENYLLCIVVYIFRLTPLLAVVVMIHATLFPFLGSGPVYPRHKQLFVENCQRYWWSALLYMQNFINSRNMVSKISHINNGISLRSGSSAFLKAGIYQLICSYTYCVYF